MTYVLLDGEGVPARWPYSLAELPRDRPDVELPEELTDEFLAKLNIYPVTPGKVPDSTPTLRSQAIPPVFTNGEWQQAWEMVEGSPPLPPSTVTPLQMRRALRAVGLKDGINAFLEATGEEAQEAWEYAVEIRRDDRLVAAAAEALGKTDEELDELFRLAATMTA